MKRPFLWLLFVVLPLFCWAAKEPTQNSAEARRVFDKVYNMVFGPQGAKMRYDVNIVGLYKTKGVICYKGKKQRFRDERVDTWNDGVTAYMVYRKKKVVEIHDANSDKKDKYSGKFKFTLDDFHYSLAREDDKLLITLKQRKDAKGTIKEVRAWVDASSYAPLRVKIKVAFFWANIEISEFKSGGISDATFQFPRSKYSSGYKFVDKR